MGNTQVFWFVFVLISSYHALLSDVSVVACPFIDKPEAERSETIQIHTAALGRDELANTVDNVAQNSPPVRRWTHLMYWLRRCCCCCSLLRERPVREAFPPASRETHATTGGEKKRRKTKNEKSKAKTQRELGTKKWTRDEKRK